MFIQTFAFCHTREMNTNLGPPNYGTWTRVAWLGYDIECHVSYDLFDAESPIGGSSSGHGNNVPSPTSKEDVEPSSGMNEDIFDDM